MNRADGQWQLQVLIGLPFAALGALLLLGGAVFAFYYAHTGYHEGDTYRDHEWIEEPRTVRIIGAGLIVALLGYVFGLGLGYWPWKAEYHQYRPVSGTVASVSSRLLTGANQKFVVTLTSGPQQYGIDDTRASLLKPGSTVALRCIRVYTYGSNAAGYDCKWGQR